MPFKDSPEGSTHYQNDGCGIPEHNTTNLQKLEKESLEELKEAYLKVCESPFYPGISQDGDVWFEGYLFQAIEKAYRQGVEDGKINELTTPPGKIR